MENRRKFLKKMAGVTAGLAIPLQWSFGGAVSNKDKFGELLPMRKLGSTGEKVTMLGLGGYHVGWTTEKDAQEVIETAINGGIRFFDTAHNYLKGASEERYGKYLVPSYRDSIFLMTKTQANDGKTLMEEFDLSLRRLKTDYVDLLQIHSLQNPKDVTDRISNGVIDAIKEIKRSGKAKYIGFTGHSDPEAQLQMMKNNPDLKEFSTTQMPINAIDFLSDHSFVKKVLPVAIENNLAVLAMKTLADGRFFGKKIQEEKEKWNTENPLIPNFIDVKDALNFSWSLPISVLITGAENKEYLLEKIQVARDFVKLSGEQRDKIIDKVIDAPDKIAIEYYKKV
ncbi:MAG: aldo/keto reductase [Bacteroidales bacterium]|nr:aldo/keto reductase [Bacteroidales bacterium]MCF8391818.1 aldo/keto reductase [Bacteroidales bacterium]